MPAVILLFAALACNLPLIPRANPQATRFVEETLQSAQETVAARIFPTLPPEIATPEPEGQPPEPAANTPEPAPAAGEAPVAWDAPATPTASNADFVYTTQAGDTAVALAGRFGVPVEQIVDPAQYNVQALLPADQPLVIANTLGALPFRGVLLPDIEIVYSPALSDFSIEAYISQAGGFLSTYSEVVDEQILTGAQIIRKVALETSTSPRMLLAVLEYRSGWVLGQPINPNQTAYPVGFYASEMTGLHKEITLVARQLSIGYYGWRSGQVTELEFANGSRSRLDPTLNAGTVALQTLFSKLVSPADFGRVLYGPDGFVAHYLEWFGSPWQRAEQVGDMLPFDLAQPVVELPFPVGTRINFTGGPHAAWGIGSPMGGIDFSPADVEAGCGVSRYWVTAGAPGIVVRSEEGQVVLDLDMDGNEHTGWSLLYLHIATLDRVPVGTRVNTEDPIGHPSCEGGVSTGTHVHMARRYNGEWLAAAGPAPFVISGWQVFPGIRPYRGSMIKGDQVVTSRIDNSSSSIFTR
jgi:LasA protease